MANKNIKGITVEIGGDTTELGKALADSEKKSKSLQSELREIETALKFNPDNVELLAQKQEILTKQVDETTKALNTLKSAEKQVTAQFESGEIGEEQYRAFQREIITTESKLKNYEGKLEDTEDTLKKLNSANKDAEKSTDKFEDELNDASKSADKLEENLEDAEKASEDFNDKMDKVAIGVGAVTAGMVALGKEAIDAFNEVDEGADNVIKATGATGELAESLEQSYTNVANTIVGDFATIGSALGEVNTRFGFTEEQAEEATTKFLKFSEVTGMDAVSAVQEVSKAIEGAGLESSDYADILDSLTTAGQVTGVSVDKLAQALSDNGAVMREMGYDTNSTIGMLAQFEKAGVDSNSVIRGMRTAIAKWSKDGKDAKKEFEKLVKGIKNGSVDAGEAYEVFGSKAGVELVDAIKSGRFEFEDMVKVVEDSKGSLESTFDGTVDGGYELELIAQKAKVKFAEFGDTVLKKVVPILADDLLPIAEKFIDYTTENIDDIIPKVKTLGIMFATVFVVNKVSKFIGSIKSLATTFKSLGVLMSAHPIGALATVLGLATGAMIALTEASKDQIKKTYGLNEAEKELNKAIKDEAESLKAVNDERMKANDNIDAEMAHNQNLWKELQTIVDANGKIKKGYEERAGVITGLLAESLGIEIKIVDGQIQKYGELKKSIEEVIRTKRAEALLEANKEAYTTAIQNQATAFSTYNEKLKQVSDSKERLSKAESEYQYLLANADAYTTSEEGALSYSIMLNDAKTAVEEATKAHKDNEKALSDAQSTYLSYSGVIESYEGLMGAVASGDVKQLNDAMNKLSNGFVTAENATRSMLETQLKEFREQYGIMKKAVAEGMPGVTQEQVDQMGKLVKEAETELNKLQPKAEKSGKLVGMHYSSGLKLTKPDAKKAGKTVSDSTNKGLGDVDSKGTGKNVGNKYALGVTARQKDAKTAGKKVASSAKSGLGSVDTKKTGSNTADKFASGVSSGTGKAKTAGTTVAKRGKDGLLSVKTNDAGKSFGDGFTSGMESKKSSIWSKAWSLGKSALKALKKALKSNSPAKETEFVGGDFDSGLEIGIEKNKDGVIDSAENLAKDAVTALNRVNEVEFGGLSTLSNSKLASKALQSKVNNSDNSANRVNTGLEDKLDKIYNSLTNLKVVLNNGVLVGEIIDDVDAGLAQKQLLHDRGV